MFVRGGRNTNLKTTFSFIDFGNKDFMIDDANGRCEANPVRGSYCPCVGSSVFLYNKTEEQAQRYNKTEEQAQR
jgi:hypothetical protein